MSVKTQILKASNFKAAKRVRIMTILFVNKFSTFRVTFWFLIYMHNGAGKKVIFRLL